MTWNEWVEQHAAMYGQLAEGGRTMLGFLATAHAAAGRFPEELAAASRWLLTNDPPRYPGDHAAALDRALRALAAAAAEAARPVTGPPPDGPPCLICGDPATGWALVPQTTADGMEQRRCCVVFCRCPLGRWRAGTLAPVRVPGGKMARVLTLDQYEELHLPDWREVMAAWREEREARARAANEGMRLDRLAGRLADGWGMGRR